MYLTNGQSIANLICKRGAVFDRCDVEKIHTRICEICLHTF